MSRSRSAGSGEEQGNPRTRERADEQTDGLRSVLEDYKEYQLTSNLAYEKLSNQLETETAKYNKLYEESNNTQYQSMLKINSLEEKVRELEIANQKYAEQYQNILDDKAKLMQTINDFTEKMSFSFSPKTTASNTPSE